MKWISRFFSWMWAGLGNIVMIVGWIGASTLLAFAAKAAGIMTASAPFSWVAIGFAGAFVSAASYALIGFGRNAAILARARRPLVMPGDGVNPMDSIFVEKRIHINDFVNPYNQAVIGKKFIRCEIIGPANLIPLLAGGKFTGNTFEQSDASEISPGVVPQNAIAFGDCDFENCRFYRVTLIFISSVRPEADKMISNLNWLILPPERIEEVAKHPPPPQPTPFERDFNEIARERNLLS